VTPSSGFALLRPAMLAWVLAAAGLLLVGLLGLALRRRDRALLVAPRHMGRFLPGYSEGRALARVAIATLGVVLLAFALTGPVRGWTMRTIQRRGLDLVVCIDTSRSMLVRDVRPDRLTRAVREVGGLIDRLAGDRLALIAFSGDAREVAPLTHDRTTLRALLERVSPEDNVVGGTDLGAALQRALSMFDGRTGAHEAIILLTDGEDLSGHGLEVARAAAERGIRIYVVGMGTEQGGKVPLPAGDGTETFLRDGDGEVISALDDSSLEKIAAATGGDFLAATRSAAPLEELYRMRISRLEGRELAGGKEWVPHDRFQWVLVLAFACMLLESGLRERAPRRRVGLAPALLVLFPLSGLGGAPLAGAQEVRRLSLEDDHAAAAEAATALLASDAFAAASEEERAEALYTVGVARQRAGERREAIEAFLSARDLAGPGELRLDAVYDVAANLLLEAEDARQQIPEVSGQQPQGASPVPGLPAPGQAAPAGGGEQGPDPLDVAEAAYRAARSAHLDRLRLDAADPDTRANLELIQRRLRELEEIRKQREQRQEDRENQQPDENQQKGDDQQQSDDQQQDDQQQDEQGQKSEDQQDQQDQQEQDSEDQQDQQEQQQQPKPEPEQESEQDQERQAQPNPAEQEEQLMSREEIQRLLDQLRDIEAQAEAVRQALAERRRVPVKKDW